MVRDSRNSRIIQFAAIVLLVFLLGGGIYYFIFFIPRHDQALRAAIIKEIKDTRQMQDDILRQVDSAKITSVFLEQLEYKRLMDEMSNNAAELLQQLMDLKARVELYQKQLNEYRLSMNNTFELKVEEEKKQQQAISSSVEILNARIKEAAENAARTITRFDSFAQAFEEFKQKQAELFRAMADAIKEQEINVNERLKALENRVVKLPEQSETSDVS